MIRVCGENPHAPGRIALVLEALDRLYLPVCAARGLTLDQRWVSPPMAVPGLPNTLRLLGRDASYPEN